MIKDRVLKAFDEIIAGEVYLHGCRGFPELSAFLRTLCKTDVTALRSVSALLMLIESVSVFHFPMARKGSADGDREVQIAHS